MGLVAIIDYEAGNLTSVARALRFLGAECVITSDPQTIARAERVVFPGVGAAGAAMASLRRLGMDQALKQAVEEGKPVLGICLGCQVVFEASEEDSAECLGLMPGRVVRFRAGTLGEDSRPIKIPHMGWNSVRWVRAHPLFAGLNPQAEFYFVHSFHPEPSEASLVIGTTCHGVEFASAVGRGSLVAVQFHPEKSGRPGLKILENFLAWDGREA